MTLPVGVSFYTFMAISYVVDTYRGELVPASFARFAVFQAFFPHLVAGPIVRASELLPQLESPRDPRKVDTSRAFFLIVTGLFLKVVIANHLASHLVDDVFAAPDQHSSLEVLVAVYGYAVQIFADFCGYTNIAIGVALLLGFEFPQNFASPYTAVSLQDFWRRWHMTLSRWLRDYLYIPLGGNRKGRLFTYRNLMLTMLLGGLWHGAAWTFVIWGGIHGLGLSIERADRLAAAHRARSSGSAACSRSTSSASLGSSSAPTRSRMRGDVITRLFTAWGQTSPLVTTSVVLAIAVGIVASTSARRLSPVCSARSAGCRSSRRPRASRSRSPSSTRSGPSAWRRSSTSASRDLMLPAYRGIVVLALGLLLAAVLQAEGLRKQAEIQPAGVQRDVALDVTRPLVSFSRALHLTTPRHELQVAIGRGDEDRIDTQVHFTLPPPAGPLPGHAGHVPGTVPGTGPKSRARPSRRSRSSRQRIRCASGWRATRSRRCPDRRSQRVGGAVDVVGVESRLSTGLGRPDLYNWFTRIEQVPAQLHPRVAVLSFGADDAHDYLAGVPSGRSVGPLGSAVVGRRVRAAGRGRHPRAERERDLRGLARPAEHRPSRLPGELPGRQRDHRARRARERADVDVRRHVEAAQRQARPVRVVPAGERHS